MIQPDGQKCSLNNTCVVNNTDTFNSIKNREILLFVASQMDDLFGFWLLLRPMSSFYTLVACDGILTIYGLKDKASNP